MREATSATVKTNVQLYYDKGRIRKILEICNYISYKKEQYTIMTTPITKTTNTSAKGAAALPA